MVDNNSLKAPISHVLNLPTLEEALHEVAASGHADAYMRLGVVLSDQTGLEMEAEAAFREAIRRGSFFSTVLLACLLINQRGRRDEGYKLLKKPRGMGIPGVSELLRTVGSNQIAELTQVRTAEEIYHAAKEIDGESRAGSYQLAVLRVVAHHGIYERQLFYEPLNSFDDIAPLLDTANALLQEYVNYRWVDKVAISFRMFESGRSAPLGRLSLQHAGDPEIDRHSVRLVAFDKSKDELVFANSWGIGWGDKGYGSLSRTYIQRYMVDAWLMRSTRHGPSRFNYKHLSTATDNRTFAKAWMIENPRWRGGNFATDPYHYKFVIHETISGADHQPVEIIEIRNGIGIKVAWAHLHHVTSDRISILKEFYVWPNFRRQGLGRRLEEAASYRARVWGSERIQILFHQIDSWLHVRAAGRLFATEMGYTWKWRDGYLPAIVAIGEKTLTPQ